MDTIILAIGVTLAMIFALGAYLLAWEQRKEMRRKEDESLRCTEERD